MKIHRFLNLNGIAGRLIGISAFFLVGVPVALAVVEWVYPALEPRRLLFVSLGIGGALLIVLGALIVIEQVQDALISKAYFKQRSRKLPGANQLYECQFCGNRQVRAEDQVCGVCGKELFT